MIRLPRSGQSDLEFHGKLIAWGGLDDEREFFLNSKGKPVDPVQRGHRIEIYRTSSGKYIMFYWFLSAWTTEPEGYTSLVYQDAESLRQGVEDYRQNNLMTFFVGPPAASQFGASNRDRLILSYRLQFEEAVGEALGGLEPEVVD